MEWLVGLPATGITAVTLVIALLIGQSRGWLYVKPQVDQMRKDMADRIDEARKDRDRRVEEVIADRAVRIAELVEERDDLREAARVLRETLRIQAEQMSDVVDVNRTSQAALQSIVRASERGGDGDG